MLALFAVFLMSIKEDIDTKRVKVGCTQIYDEERSRGGPSVLNETIKKYEEVQIKKTLSHLWMFSINQLSMNLNT